MKENITIYTKRKRIAHFITLVFVIIELLPNFFLFFTEEEMSLSLKMANICLPLAFFLFIYGAFRNPGVIRWLLFPKFLVDVFQYVILYLFGCSVISVDMYLNLVTSGSAEASELMSNIYRPIVIGILSYTPIFFLAYWSIKKKYTTTHTFRVHARITATAIFLLGILFAHIPNKKEHYFKIKEDIYPINVFYNQYFAVQKWQKLHLYSKKNKLGNNKFSFEATKIKKNKQQEIIIAVIGETSRALTWQLYGYPKKTNPLLSKEKNLLIYQNALTQANATHKSVPIILSYGSAENFEIIYKQKSVVTAFKEAGFYTSVISNQLENPSFITDFYNEADYYKNITKNNDGTISIKYDSELIPYVKRVIKKHKEDLFIILHTYGSHFNYCRRYPSKFKQFKPDNVDALDLKYKKEMQNAYCNTIIYTDYVLDKLISNLKDSKACTSMLFLSDHGEDLFDDYRHRFLHSSPTPTFYQLHIPLFIWLSDEHLSCYPNHYKEGLLNTQKAVSTNSIFHTLLNLADIKTKYKDTSYSLISKDFKKRSRNYLNDHDKPVCINKCGIWNIDRELLKKLNNTTNLSKKEDLYK